VNHCWAALAAAVAAAGAQLLPRLLHEVARAGMAHEIELVWLKS
jgi:hypothetical protein